MKRDDFGMRIDEIRELATKYSKNDLARMVQMGMIEPQKALMAGMMIDRIAKSALEPPKTTVAQDVLEGPPPVPEGQMPEGIMGAPGAPAPSPGVAALPSGMREMAGGGIVAFADGGDTDDIPRYADGRLVSDTYYDPRRYIPEAPKPAPAAPAAPAESGLPTLPGGYKLRDYPTMDKPTLLGELNQVREAERLAGVDTAGLIQQMREEEQARRGELRGRKEEAQGEALMMAGLGLMGARRGQEFQVLAGVSRQALAQYGGALREIRDTEKDIKKTERELALAEDRLKRDQSNKAFESYKNKLTKAQDLEIHKIDLQNKTIGDLAKYFFEDQKLTREQAGAMARTIVQANTQITVEEMQQRGADRRTGVESADERIIRNVLADLKKTNPNATYSDAVQAVKAGARTGTVTDKELQDAYEARRKSILGKTALAEFDAKYPSWREFAAEQRGQAGAPPRSGFTEGQESKDTNGRPIVYRNGQWVYK